MSVYLRENERREAYEKLGRLLFEHDWRFAQAIENIIGCAAINFQCRFHKSDAQMAQEIDRLLIQMAQKSEWK